MMKIEELPNSGDAQSTSEKPLGGAYTIKVVDNMEAFYTLKDPWDSLAYKHGAEFPFLCFDWFKIWLEQFLMENHLVILLLYRDDTLVAIAPFLMRREKFKSVAVNKIELIGNAYSPIRGFLFKDSEEEGKTQCLSMILKYLFDSFQTWDIIDINPVGEDDASKGLIYRIANANSYRTVEDVYYENWYMQGMPSSGEEYFSQRTKTFRKELRKRKKNLEQLGNLRFVVIENDLELDRFIDYYYEIYSRSWKKRESIGPTFHRHLARLSADKGWLRLGFIFLDDTPIAASFVIVFNGVAYLLKSAYDETYKRYGLGTLLRTEMIKYVIDRDGVKEIDMGPGAESYKQFFVSKKRDMKGLIIFNRNLKGKSLFLLTGRILPMMRKHEALRQIKNFIIHKA